MDKTFDVLNDKALAVFDDRLPVVFKYNGETLRKLSALTKNVNNSETNVNEVSYTSEYNRSLRNLEVSGNTTQKQYEGYNPFKFKDFTTSKTDSDGNVITLEIKDGIATINGKSNVFTTLMIDYQVETSKTRFKAGTYTFTPFYYRQLGGIGIRGCDWQLGGHAFTGNTGLATKTFENEFGFAYCAIYIPPNTEFKDYKFAPAIFEGTYTSLDELPPYEPYVGGIPSPNPGQKIPIYSTSESTVTLNTELEASEITYDSNFLYTIAFEHPFSFNGAESLTLSVDSFYTGSAGDMLIVGGDPSNIIGGSGTFDYIAAGDGSRGEVTIHSSDYGDTFYIGIGNTDTGISNDKIEEYRQLAITTPITATGTITTQTGLREIPAYPQEIENANKEGMSVTLHGYNLLNKEEFSLSAFKNETEYKGYGAAVLNVAQVNTMLKPNTTYTMSFEVEGVVGMPDGATIHSGQGFIFIPKLSGVPYIFTPRSNKIANKGEVYTHTVTFITVSNFYEAEYTLYVYTGRYTRTDGTMDNATCIFRNVQIVESAEAKPFQPYFREEISIPTSVEVEGATVELNMASISIIHSNGKTYTATDYLTVDRLSNKVLYHQNVGKMTLTSTNVVWSYVPTYKYFIFSTNIGSKKSYNPIISNKYIGFAHIGLMASKDYGITTDAQWWGVNNRITIRDIRFDNLTDFKADLDQNPLVIEYGLAEEITHDITNTDFGNLILDLTNKIPYGTIYLEVNSGLSVPITVDYAKWGGDLPEGEE